MKAEILAETSGFFIHLFQLKSKSNQVLKPSNAFLKYLLSSQPIAFSFCFHLSTLIRFIRKMTENDAFFGAVFQSFHFSYPYKKQSETERFQKVPQVWTDFDSLHFHQRFWSF